jgi:ABC-type multidrug transport system permease subunit
VSWRRLRTLLLREARATLRDPFMVSVLILVPIMSLLAFGYVLSTSVKHLKLAVLDADGSAASRRIIDELAANGTFDPNPVATREELDNALVSGRVGVAIIIPPGFDRSRRRTAPGDPAPEVQVIYDGGEAVLAGNAEGFLRGILAAQSAAPPGGVHVATRALFNPRLDGEPFMVSGTFGFVLSFLTTVITAVSIVNERQTGTFDQLQVTPATSLEILIGKILPLGAVFALDVVLMVVTAGVVLGVWPNGSVVLFVVVSSGYVLISLALGLIFSATSSTAAEAVQKTVLFSIPLVQLSGFAFAIRNMPTVFQWIAEAFPATHYIRVSRAIYIRGAGVGELVPELLILGVSGAILIGVALRTIEARS